MNDIKDIPEDIADYLSYDPDTGELRWIKRSARRIKLNDVAGHINGQGYSAVRFKGTSFQAHRIAWFLHYDEQPPVLIDHRNRNKCDNRIANLYDEGDSFNRLNTEALGYSWHKASEKFQVRYSYKHKATDLGLHYCPLLARLTYVNALEKEGVSLPLVPTNNNIKGREDLCS